MEVIDMEDKKIELDVSSMVQEIEARSGLLNQYMLKSQNMFNEIEILVKKVIEENPNATREEVVEMASNLFEQRQEELIAQQNNNMENENVDNKEEKKDDER